MTWAEKVKLIQGDLTLTELAKRLDVPVSTLNDIKRGASIAPRGMTAVRIHEIWLSLVTTP